MVQPALFQTNSDIGPFAGFVRLDQRDPHSLPAHIYNFNFGIHHASRKVAMLLVEVPDHIFILLQFGGIEALGEQFFEKDRVRNTDRPQALHGTPNVFVGEDRVALHGNLANLHLWAFVHLEDHLQRGRRNLAKIGFHGGELTAALSQIFLQHIGGSLDLIRIVLRFHGQTDFPLLESVEYFRDRNGLGAIVFDGTDHTPFGDEVADDPPGRAGLLFELDIVETAGIPKCHEIPMQRIFVVLVAFLGKCERPQRFLRYAPGTAKLDRVDHVLGTGGWLCRFGGSLGRLQLKLPWFNLQRRTCRGWRGVRSFPGRHRFKRVCLVGRWGLLRLGCWRLLSRGWLRRHCRRTNGG